MREHLTSKQNVALNIFDDLGESRFNRSSEEYLAIKRRLPPLKRLHGMVNDRLQETAKSGAAPYEICRFMAGDKEIWYQPYPKSLSFETVRSALVNSGMRDPRSCRTQKVSATSRGR
jgi:hypothetical protein